MRLTINALLIVAIMFACVRMDINEIKTHLKPTLDNFSLIIRGLGATNADNAERATLISNGQSNIYIDESLAAKVRFQSLNNSQKYIFHSDKTLSVRPNGTFIGLAKQEENQSIKNITHLFIADKFWASYHSSPLILDNMLVSYLHQYVYYSRFYDIENATNISQIDKITPQFLTGRLNEQVGHIIKEYGFFITEPYDDFLSGQRIVSIVSPVYKNNNHVADVATNLGIDNLRDLIYQYPKLENNIAVDVQYLNGDRYPLVHNHNTIWTAFSYQYNMPFVGHIVTKFDVLFFVKKNLSLFLFLVLLSFVINLYIEAIQKEKQANSELKHELYHDSLTGIYNRKIIQDYAYSELQTHLSHGHHSAIIAIDADEFKFINDNYGHLSGDQALIFIAHTINGLVEDGYVIRMGGDEFMILLTNASIERAKLIAQLIELNIQNGSEDRLGFPMTVTTGYTEVKHKESFKSVYTRVDEILYINKRNKKEKTFSLVSNSELVSSAEIAQ
ncbi:MAG: diguanylate cyclase domain-containing protein [Vibrio sp.]